MAPASSVQNLRRRVKRLAAALRVNGLEGVLVVPGPNLAYYTGVKAHLFERPFLLLIDIEGEAYLLAPKLEAGPFRASIPLHILDWDDTAGPGRAFASLLEEINHRGTWGCEGRTPFGFLDHLLRRGMKVRAADTVLQSIREVKEPEELKLLRKSAEILSAAVLRVPENLHEGVTERELALAISEEGTARGAEEVEPMVQSGARAADPHSVTTSRKVGRGESVVVDVVSSYGGYAADITRTFVLGGGPVERTYDRVLSAQSKAIESARAGVTTGEVDASARGSLAEDGLAEYFIHRTGHGLGLEVHEAPFIVSGGRELLRPRMAFTVEPGVYLPGKHGVRIEDDVIISDQGTGDVITAKVPKEFGWWRR